MSSSDMNLSGGSGGGAASIIGGNNIYLGKPGSNCTGGLGGFGGVGSGNASTWTLSGGGSGFSGIGSGGSGAIDGWYHNQTTSNSGGKGMIFVYEYTSS